MNGHRRRFAVLLALLVAGCNADDGSARAPGDSALPPARELASAAADSATSGGAAQAADVVRAYYEAIGARDFGRAYGLWSDSGRASGKTLSEFTRGFAQTAAVDATLEAPGRVEGAAGSRYVDIPVQVTARQRDGSTQQFRGSYSLRRAVVTGASAEQRRWHLYTASLQPVP